MKFKDRQLKGDLSIIQWVHFVPAYDDWFDNTWVKQWGQANDVQVNVEHINNTLLDTRAAAEVAAQSGHDLFMNLHPMASYEDQVINHASIIKEIEKKVGKYGALAKASTYNPKTKKYFAVSDNYVPDPVVWRHDIWNGIGEAPFTWDHVRKAAPKLKAIGHPIGIGQSQELDSNMALLAFMMCFGVVRPERGQPPDAEHEEDGPGREVHGRPLHERRGRGDLRLEPRVEQQLPLLRHGVDDPERDLGDADAGGAEPAVLEGPLDLADPARAATGATGSST